LNHLDAFKALGYPVLIGASRKRFLGSMLGDSTEKPVEPRQRDHATAAVTTQVAEAGVGAVRVHSVIPTVDAVKTVAARQAAHKSHRRHYADRAASPRPSRRARP